LKAYSKVKEVTTMPQTGYMSAEWKILKSIYASNQTIQNKEQLKEFISTLMLISLALADSLEQLWNALDDENNDKDLTDPF